MRNEYRDEKDFLGVMRLPADGLLAAKDFNAPKPPAASARRMYPKDSAERQYAKLANTDSY
jgi:hypothetical protein